MITLLFDVMCNGKFIMQYSYKWCLAFRIDFSEVRQNIIERKPFLKNKKFELYVTTNRVI